MNLYSRAVCWIVNKQVFGPLYHKAIPSRRILGLSAYNFHLSGIKNSDDHADVVVKSLIEHYNENKLNLIQSKFQPHHFHTIEAMLTEVVSAMKEKCELEEFETTESDPQLKKLAHQDLKDLDIKIEEFKNQLMDFIMGVQNTSVINEVVVEVSAGVGGQEAMLFAQDLLQMYHNFCLFKGWEVAVIEQESTPIGGLRRASLNVKGDGSYPTLLYEAGIHRVQRTPKTEKAGRVHTSTASVAVLPQPSEIVVEIHPNDLKIEAMRATGAGGQHVNTTDSAVRVKHLPSGVTVECQTTRSQEQNRKQALKKLRSMLYQQRLDEQEAQHTSQRKLQVGVKARSEKIRTYNFNQDRVTDHRIGESVYNLEEVLKGGAPLKKLIDTLSLEGRRENVLRIFNNNRPN